MARPRLPALYLPHGGGPSFFMSGERRHRYQDTENFLRGVRDVLPTQPEAILIVTAHWGKVPGNYVMLIDQPARNAWPISGAKFILVPRNPA